MTNEEAIKLLNRLKDRLNFEVTDAQLKMDALNMAIKALEEPKTGHWVPNPYHRDHDGCSNCGIGCKRREYGLNPDGTEYVTEHSYKYCPY